MLYLNLERSNFTTHCSFVSLSPSSSLSPTFPLVTPNLSQLWRGYFSTVKNGNSLRLDITTENNNCWLNFVVLAFDCNYHYHCNNGCNIITKTSPRCSKEEGEARTDRQLAHVFYSNSRTFRQKLKMSINFCVNLDQTISFFLRWKT